MNRSGRSLLFCWLLVFFSFQAGCHTPGRGSANSQPFSTLSAVSPMNSAPSDEVGAVRHANHSPQPGAESTAIGQKPDENPFAGVNVLSVDALVQQVVARNPSLAEMVAVWQAASARYPQVTSLDDPMFGAAVAPTSIGSNEVDFGYRLEVAQKLPFPGKLGLRGQNALAEAAAAANDVGDVRLQLVESAKHAFYEYYLVHRALEVNEESLRLLRRFKQDAENRFRTAGGSVADIHQADVELGRQRERALLLERMRQVAIARLNTLMHLPPDAFLPPPAQPLLHVLGKVQPVLGAIISQWSPITDFAIAAMLEAIKREEALPAVEYLRSAALARRPDLQALANRIAAEHASLALADKEFYPDFEAMAMYDAFWQEKDLRAALALRFNLPVRKERRFGAIAEAQARIAQRQAELAKQIDQMNFEVQQAYAQAVEGEKVVRLYETAVLPDARKNVEAAQREYSVGKVPFLTLIEAQRNLVSLSDRYYEAVADYYRRRATLERSIGGPVAPSSSAPGPE